MFDLSHLGGRIPLLGYDLPHSNYVKQPVEMKSSFGLTRSRFPSTEELMHLSLR